MAHPDDATSSSTLVDKTAKKKPLHRRQGLPEDAYGGRSGPSAPGSDDDLNAWLVNFANGKVSGNAGQKKFPLRLVRASA